MLLIEGTVSFAAVHGTNSVAWECLGVLVALVGMANEEKKGRVWFNRKQFPSGKRNYICL
jgi:hypothetical protein